MVKAVKSEDVSIMEIEESFALIFLTYPTSCTQNHLDTQECVFYTSLRKKEILINYNYQ